jgi:hypothetical protein
VAQENEKAEGNEVAPDQAIYGEDASK